MIHIHYLCAKMSLHNPLTKCLFFFFFFFFLHGQISVITATHHPPPIRIDFDSLLPSNAVRCSDWLIRGSRKREAHRLRVLDYFLGRVREP